MKRGSLSVPRCDPALQPRLKMAPKDAIMSLPTEVVENIACRLAAKRLLALRRAHPQLADRSSDAFSKAFLSKITWFIGHRNIDAQIRGLLTRPHFASRVTSLRVEPVMVYCHKRCTKVPVICAPTLPIQECVALMSSLVLLSYGPGSPTAPFPFTPRLHAPLIKLVGVPSLRSLYLGPARMSPPGNPSHPFVMQSQFDIEDVNVDVSTIVALLLAHKLTLYKVQLTMVCLRGSWLELLAAVRQLSSKCNLCLFAPSFVSKGYEKAVDFEPQQGDVDQDSIEMKRCSVAFRSHFSSEKKIVRMRYTTRDNQLHRAVDCMIRNYKVVSKEPY
ncbi:hypothetical protein FKW77_002247 [Venturia effusa]|uniref:F-box domain-containing protein n=1 Tax=Venturia effusa TaxID=50376 RepID=A0A517L6T3_9PEZI|nr:hypothetical protein FKW77_002247 [Venturia effusa]